MAQHNISNNDSTASDYHSFLRELKKFDEKHGYVVRVFIRVLAGIEIPVMILTLIALCFIIKSRPAASVFISNLIISDLIQVICLLEQAASSTFDQFGPYLYSFSVGLYFMIYPYSFTVSLYFMACVAFERYLLVSHPIWYKSHQSLKLSCFISVIIWCVPLIFVFLYVIFLKPLPMYIGFFIPYIIIILCFVGTWRGLSRAISLTALKRKLILGSLLLVLLTYTFLILPFLIIVSVWYLNSHRFKTQADYTRYVMIAQMLMFVNPLADCVLYLFMRPDVRNMMKSVHCCCRLQRLKHSQDEHSVVNPQNCCSTVVCCISAQKPASVSLNTCSSV